jgi:hypothetical protein
LAQFAPAGSGVTVALCPAAPLHTYPGVPDPTWSFKPPLAQLLPAGSELIATLCPSAPFVPFAPLQT